MNLEKRIAKAKTQLVLHHPFFGALALNMDTILTDEVPTAATNGKYIKYNPSFCADLSDEELLFLVAHECMHPMLCHHARINGRDPRRYNMAGDYVINKSLIDEGIGKFIVGGLHSEAIFQQGGGTTDGIYNILPQESDSDSGSDDRIGQDIVPTEGNAEQEEGEWKVKVAQSAQAARMAGKLSANMARLVDTFLHPKVDWTDVLRRFIQKTKVDSRTFSRPNRRFISQGMYLPSVTGETLGEIVFAVDMSGSIRDDEAQQYISEVRTVHEDNKPTRLHVVYFSHEVTGHDSFDPDDTFDTKPRGNGGTAFSPVFKHIEEHGIEPVACVFLTDLYCHDFGDMPDYPVLWVTTGATEAPFGEVVRM